MIKMKVSSIKQVSSENRINSFQCGKTKIAAINKNRKNKEKESKFLKLNIEDNIKITEI